MVKKGSLKHALISLMAAYMIHADRFYRIINPRNRELFFWSWDKAAALLTVLASTALIFFLAAQVLSRLQGRVVLCLRGVAVYILIVILVRFGLSVVQPCIADSDIWLAALLRDMFEEPVLRLTACLIVPLPVLAVFSALASRITTAVYCILSPAVLMLVWTVITSPKYVTGSRSLEEAISRAEGRARSTQAGDILVFFMDEWSYIRTFDLDGGVATNLPHIAELKRTSTCYHRAQSPFGKTSGSIPFILFQNDDIFVKRPPSEGDAILRLGIRPTNSILSVYSPPWFSCIVGWRINYYQLAAHLVDFCYSIPWPPEAEFGFLASIGYYLHPFLSLPGRMLSGLEPQPHAVTSKWREVKVHEAIETMSFRVLEEAPRPLFGVFHYVPPHPGFVFKRDGYKRVNPQRPYLRDYIDNLEFADTVIGGIVAKLKEVGRYDDSLIIFLADHSFRQDPQFVAGDPYPTNLYDIPLPSLGRAERLTAEGAAPALRHVPLFVKYPRQRAGREIWEPIDTRKIYDIIRETFPPPSGG